MDRTWIDRFEAGGEKLRQSVAGLGRAEMMAYPVPGTWSIHEIVIHVADSDAIGIHRMKRVIAEENPLLIGYDENKFIKNLFYAEQSPEAAIQLVELGRQEFVKVLRKLPDETFKRTGVHNERGMQTLAQMVESYTKHLEHHLTFVATKRAKLGK